MSDLHKIQITGRLGNDPERHDTAQFKEAKASIYVNNSFKDGDDWKKATTCYPLAFYNNLSDKAMKLEKGQKVFIDGKLSVKTYMKDGQERTYTKIVVIDVTALSESKSSQKTQQAGNSPATDFDDDDSIPF